MIGSAMSTQPSKKPRDDSGFSLIELLIAVAIVGLLLALAVPGYREHVRRGAVEEAQAELGRGKVALEQFFLDNRTYDGAPCPSGTTRFAFTCDLDDDTFTITATGSGNVAGFRYTINETGTKTTTSTDWGTSASCWIIKKGGTCGG
jgi:type IV pilus assembly protein PilE